MARSASPEFRRHRRVLAAVLLLVLWGLITHGTFAGSGDEPHYQLIAHSIAFDGDFNLQNNYHDPSNLIFGGTLTPGAHAIATSDGVLRPVHDVGFPMVAAPFYAGAYLTAEFAGTRLPESWLRRAKLNTALLLRQFLSLGMIALTIWIGLRLFDVFTSFESRSRRAALWAALFTLSPPVLSHSFLFFTEIASAAIVLAIVAFLQRPTARLALMSVAGFAIGYLLLVHARNAGIVAALSGIVVWQLWKRPDRARLLSAFVAALLGAGALRAVITHLFWGTWLTTPHARFGSGLGAAGGLESLTRILGWLFDQEHGLLLYAPIYLLAPFGAVVLWKRRRHLCAQLLLVIGVYVIVMALPWFNTHGWRGGWTPAARFLLPIIPLAAILVFAGVAAFEKTPVWIRVLVAVQLVVNATVWQNPKLLWNEGDGRSALLEFVAGGRIDWPRYAPSLPTLAPAPMLTVIALATVGVAWMILSVRVARVASLRVPPDDTSPSGA